MNKQRPSRSCGHEAVREAEKEKRTMKPLPRLIEGPSSGELRSARGKRAKINQARTNRSRAASESDNPPLDLRFAAKTKNFAEEGAEEIQAAKTRQFNDAAIVEYGWGM